MKFQNNRDVISKSTACLEKAPPEENRVKMATSDKDTAHRNVIKFCFDLGMTPVDSKEAAINRGSSACVSVTCLQMAQTV